MSTPIGISGALLRNRFRITLGSGLEAPGFVYDKARLPGQEIDRGSAVGVGSFWDGDNTAFEDQFHIPEVSGVLEFSWKRANITRGQAFLVAGNGDNDDLELSGIDVNASGTSWSPVIEPGIFFDLDVPFYLYSQNAIETVISGSSLFINIAVPVAQYKPISLASFYANEWGRARVYEAYRQKHAFTSISDSGTFTQISGINEPLYDQVVWGDVSTSGFECFVDASQSGIVQNQTITSGVHARLRRVSWSQENIQLPLIPVVSISGVPVFYIYEDPVAAVDGIASPLLGTYGMVEVLVTGSGYVRASGNIDNTDTVIAAVPTASGVFPGAGMILVDDGDERREIISYASFSGIYFSGLTRSATTVGNSGIIHRDGAQIRLIVSGVVASGIYVSGVNLTTGDYLVNYQISGLSYTLEGRTGLLTVPELSGIHRVEADLRYTRGLLLCYEPSGSSEFVHRASGLNLNPLSHGVENGIIWAGMFPLRPARIKLETSRSKNDDGTIGPVYAGNDFLVVNARILSDNGAPVPQETVTLVLENPVNAGFINAEDPGPEFITRVSDGTGTARFVYTPPDTIHGLGYFIPSGNLVGSGLILVNDIPIEEVWSEAEGYKSLLFSVYNDDTYTTYSQTSGALDFSADGRFELVTVLSGGDVGTYSHWDALEPTVLLDSDGVVVTASGSRISQIIYAPSSIPTGTDIGAYFVSVERRVSIGAMIPGSNIASESVEVIVGIPRFMTGEFLFGEIDAPDTSSFDSLAYLTVNPFERRIPTDARWDPRSLGHVFRIRGSVTNQIRHKFYLGIDYDTLQSTPTGQDEIRKIHAMRNRFILEI